MLIFVDFFSDSFKAKYDFTRKFLQEHGSLDKILSWQNDYHGKILARSCQDLTKILLRYPWRVRSARVIIKIATESIRSIDTSYMYLKVFHFVLRLRCI